MKQKGFAPIIILFLVAVVVVGFFGYKYFQSNSQSFNYLSTSSPTPNIDGGIYNLTEMEAIALVKAKYPQVKNLNKTNSAFGSTFDIKTKKNNELWKLTFYQGSGDCPSGCINSQNWYFTVDNKKRVTKIGEYKRTFDSKTNSYIEFGSPIWDFLD